MEYLVAAVDEGSFTAAARRLEVAQPTLSHQVRALEATVGETLLERAAGRGAPTPAGRAYLPHAAAALHAAERGAPRVPRRRGGPSASGCGSRRSTRSRSGSCRARSARGARRIPGAHRAARVRQRRGAAAQMALGVADVGRRPAAAPLERAR